MEEKPEDVAARLLARWGENEDGQRAAVLELVKMLANPFAALRALKVAAEIGDLLSDTDRARFHELVDAHRPS